MEPQVLALRLVVYPPRDAAGAGEGTKAASAGGTQGAVSRELRRNNLLH